MQCALFGSGDPSFDAALRGIRRGTLSDGAWFEHHQSWLEGHERVFRELEQAIDWQSHRRMMYEREVDVPRLVARAPSEGRLAKLLCALARTLEARYGRPFPNISLAYYRNGNDSVAFHGDKLGRLVDDAIVATVSVGEPRRFLLKPQRAASFAARAPQPALGASAEAAAIGGARSALSFDLGWGDLFVMGGTCQRTWQHAIPKRSHAQPRISIMFRPAVPDS
jgi:alkylated DNA repair dioxygenase AlkB